MAQRRPEAGQGRGIVRERLFQLRYASDPAGESQILGIGFKAAERSFRHASLSPGRFLGGFVRGKRFGESAYCRLHAECGLKHRSIIGRRSSFAIGQGPLLSQRFKFRIESGARGFVLGGFSTQSFEPPASRRLPRAFTDVFRIRLGPAAGERTLAP